MSIFSAGVSLHNFAAKKHEANREEGLNASAGKSVEREWTKPGQICSTTNISLVKLRYWTRKLKPAIDDDSAFIQLNGFGIQGINLRYPNGVELTLPVQTPVGVLRSLIQF